MQWLFERQTSALDDLNKPRMINISGLIGIIIFYLVIVLIGVWASRKQKKENNAEEEIMLAGRNIGLFVGIFTMTGRSMMAADGVDV